MARITSRATSSDDEAADEYDDWSDYSSRSRD